MTSSTSADSRGREETRGGRNEAKRDVGIVIMIYRKVAAELDYCSKRLLVASEERKKGSCECDQKSHIILVKQVKGRGLAVKD